MSWSLIAVVVLVSGIAWIFLKQSGSGKGAGSGTGARAPVAPVARVSQPAPPAPPEAPAVPVGWHGAIPPEVGALHLATSSELEPARFSQLVAHLSEIRRPPQSLHKLVSAEFLAQASSAQLSDLVMVEPELAANVLATVNSPLYGLSRPVSSVGQATTYIGTTAVRNICLQYLLSASFVAPTPRLKRLYDETWNASVLASELCFKLAQSMRLPDAGELTTQVLLSFIGRFATYSLLPEEVAVQAWNATFVDAVRIEQEHLGLSAAALSGLLMREWGVPEPLIRGVLQMEQVLVTPFASANTDHGARAALSYACARIGERLANASLDGLKDFAFNDQAGADFCHMVGYLQHPSLSLLPSAMCHPDVVNSIQQMLEAMRLRR
jgi:HD-like signal output (HDOD) protein